MKNGYEFFLLILQKPIQFENHLRFIEFAKKVFSKYKEKFGDNVTTALKRTKQQQMQEGTRVLRNIWQSLKSLLLVSIN